MPRGIASNGEVSYSVTNLDSALTMLMAMYVYGEEAVKDTKQIALGNTTVSTSELLEASASDGANCELCCKGGEDYGTQAQELTSPSVSFAENLDARDDIVGAQSSADIII
ncbi:hypothetical protein ElyMa_005834800 [Elysia marginata]|uniref:Uncharacterized protein n=1 Tax=Elysia marginata TaxID=1093978 RepID=A0AAV4FWM4_9GAST|nr:hypothetical protein ElyMa_005834800 [Elysia marginata]